MLGIIQSELLKMRHTFSMKLVILAPLVTLLLGYLLSGSYVQLSTYNWWYSMILPLVVSLCSAIPTRIVYPFFKMHANGIPLESGSPLLSGEYVLPALIISLVFAFVVFWSSSKLFSRGGRTHG